MIRKLRGLKLCQFDEILQELKNILPQLPGTDKSKNIPQEELNDILFNGVPHGWAKQAMMLGFDFKIDPLCSAPELSKRMAVAKSIS